MLRAERVKLNSVFSTARKWEKLAILRAEMERERVKLNSVFPTPRKWGELAILRAKMERVKLNRIDLDAKVNYKTYLVSGVVTAVIS